MLRCITDSITRFLGWLLRKRQVRAPTAGKLIKANLGAGLAVTPGWINVDGSLNSLFASWPKRIHKILYKISGASKYYTFVQYHSILRQNRFVFHDLSYSVPFADNTMDCVFSSHFLEHLSREDGARLISEIYRVLKPRGRVRFLVPDLAYAMSMYSRGKGDDMLQNYFFVESRGSYYARHKYMYDFSSLKNLLAENNFTEIEKCTFRKGHMPDVEQLDNHPEDSLFVEAIKPTSSEGR